jgi:hypothetical protein
MKQNRIVTECQGSWKWQNAYRITTYEPRELKNGRICWQSVSVSGKMSMPQIRRAGLDHLKKYSLHNVPLTWDELCDFKAGR